MFYDNSAILFMIVSQMKNYKFINIQNNIPKEYSPGNPIEKKCTTN